MSAAEFVARFDFARGRLSKLERTPSGGVRVEACLAEVGVLTYQRADGSTVREYVPASTLSDPAALATLRDAPVTVGHPVDPTGQPLISPATHKRHAVGHVSDVPRVDGAAVVATLAIQDEETIRRLDSGELVEISAGYLASIDPKGGTWNGERFDRRQGARRYNHIALVPAGFGRGGPNVRVRLDGRAFTADAEVSDGEGGHPFGFHTDGRSAPPSLEHSHRGDSRAARVPDVYVPASLRGRLRFVPSARADSAGDESPPPPTPARFDAAAPVHCMDREAPPSLEHSHRRATPSNRHEKHNSHRRDRG